jgi:hypothetical protein
VRRQSFCLPNASGTEKNLVLNGLTMRHFLIKKLWRNDDSFKEIIKAIADPSQSLGQLLFQDFTSK